MPSAQLVPISPATLKWAMDEWQIDADEVAASLDVDLTNVLGWLTGHERPSTGQLRALSKLLRRSPQFFLLASPPDGAATPPAFRGSPAGDVRDLSDPEHRALSASRRAQKVAAWIRDQVGPHFAPLPERGPSQTPDALAAQMRAHLQWTVQEQTQLPSSAAVLRNLRGRLEDAGILVFHHSMGMNGARGFSIYHEVAPVVAVNTRYSTEARLFTYLHEMGHLVRRADAICAVHPSPGLETWCERFAASFLLPQRALQAYVQDVLGQPYVEDLATVRRIAAYFRVSITAMAIRLEHLGLAVRSLYDQIDRSSDYAKKPGFGRGGATRAERRLLTYGRSYPDLLLRGAEEGLLQSHDLLNYMSLQSSDVPALQSAVASRVELIEEE